MFFRKLCVIFVPLLLLTLLCIFLPMIEGIGFLGNVLKGTLFGVVLGLVLPPVRGIKTAGALCRASVASGTGRGAGHCVSVPVCGRDACAGAAIAGDR